MSQLANLPRPDRSLLRVSTEGGLGGLTNGVLLKNAEAEFDVFITADSNLSFQQNVPTFKIAVIVLHAESTQLHHTMLLMPKVASLLATLKSGDTIDVYP
jgi:hypothetical protein